MLQCSVIAMVEALLQNKKKIQELIFSVMLLLTNELMSVINVMGKGGELLFAFISLESNLNLPKHYLHIYALCCFLVCI